MKLLKLVNEEFKTAVVQVTHSEHNAGYGSRILVLSDGKTLTERGEGL